MKGFTPVRLVALGGLALSGVILFVVALVQHGKFRADTDARLRTERQTTSVLLSLEAADAQPKGRQSVVPDEPAEEERFLTFLRTSAVLSRVKIVRYIASDPEPVKADTSPVLKGLLKRTGMVVVSGPYRQVLAFARRLEEGDRLLALNDVRWDRTEAGVHLSAQVSRYVTDGTAPAAPAPTPVPPQ